MSSPWTIERVLALAPDASSAKAGRELGRASKWRSLARSERAVWGEIQGSGKDPYRIRVDQADVAFGCSCPSRKFPCKHGLGLLLVLAQEPDAVPSAAEPDWVSEWLSERARKAEAKVQRQAAKSEAPADVEAQRERAEKRVANVQSGVEELATWLCDLVRQGVAVAKTMPSENWQRMASRLVDTQAPGLAARVRDLPAILHAPDAGDARFLEALGRLYLACEAWRRLDTLPMDVRSDVRAFVGVPWKESELAGLPRSPGRWIVVARSTEQEERLRVQRTWLVEANDGRRALVLDFAVRGAALDASLATGTCVDADLVFHPASTPLRASVAHVREAVPWSGRVPGLVGFEEMIVEHGRASAANPWTTARPYCVHDATPVVGPRTTLRDSTGAEVLLRGSELVRAQVSAISGGRPIDVFGTWDGGELEVTALMRGSTPYVLVPHGETQRLGRAG